MVTARPVVSIVITCFNEERFLPEAIESALSQIYPFVETIVVDDGSTDGSVKVAARYEPRVTVVRKVNGGLSSARNAGIEAAAGEYVTFLDADDILLPAFASKTVPFLEADPNISWVYTQLRHFGRETHVSEFPEFDVQRLVAGNYLRATALLRSEVFADTRFDERLRTGWEDWDFFLSLVERGRRGQLVDEPLMLYRKHPEADRMSDVMVAPPIKRRARLYIMRRHLRLFGVWRYTHYLAHHVKTTLAERWQ